MIIATTTESREIVWPTIRELMSFSESQTIIAEGTNVVLSTPPRNQTKAVWEPIAQMILHIAAADYEALEHPLKAEIRSLLQLM